MRILTGFGPGYSLYLTIAHHSSQKSDGERRRGCRCYP